VGTGVDRYEQVELSRPTDKINDRFEIDFKPVDQGRAYALSDDKDRAKSAYQDFLTLWEDADPDIPILKQAKAEFAKLQ
jgi:uncharacterized protein YciW